LIRRTTNGNADQFCSDVLKSVSEDLQPFNTDLIPDVGQNGLLFPFTEKIMPKKTTMGA